MSLSWAELSWTELNCDELNYAALVVFRASSPLFSSGDGCARQLEHDTAARRSGVLLRRVCTRLSRPRSRHLHPSERKCRYYLEGWSCSWTYQNNLWWNITWCDVFPCSFSDLRPSHTHASATGQANMYPCFTSLFISFIYCSCMLTETVDAADQVESESQSFIQDFSPDVAGIYAFCVDNSRSRFMPKKIEVLTCKPVVRICSLRLWSWC